MLSINTNVSSLITQNRLSMSNSALKTSLERLSSGFRINHASDDAANLSVSKKMNCQISGSEVAIDNVQQGIDLVTTADSTLGEIQGMAQRIRDLSLEALNGTYSSEERKMMQNEVASLVSEIYRQKNAAKYNNIKLFGEIEDEPVIVPEPEIEPPGRKEIVKLSEEEAIKAGYSVIKSVKDFENILSNTSGKYCLMGDIDFSQVSNWGYKAFGGELNGNGYSINNFEAKSSDAYASLFSQISGTLKNLSMNNVDINVKTIAGAFCQGLFGTLENCSATGNVTTNTDFSGGLVGYSNGTIKNCESLVNVVAANKAGGIVGSNQNGANIISSKYTGTISGNQYIGGLVGLNTVGGNITGSYSSASVTGLYCIGGLLGYNASSSVQDSVSEGTVTGQDDIGGLVGYSSNSTISGCTSSASVEDTLYGYAGGLVGNAHNSNISDSSASGNVSGTGDYIGGLVGFSQESTISNSSANGRVEGANNVGGILGCAYLSDVSGVVSNADVSGDQYVGGIVGWNYTANIDNAKSTGNIEGSVGVGGLIGVSEYSSVISNSTTSGIITGDNGTGGLIGYNQHGSSIQSSSSSCEVVGNKIAGGLVGFNTTDAQIIASSASGNVSGYSYIGGLVGCNEIGSTISTSYATGDVTASKQIAGGLTGANQDGSFISESYATGDVYVSDTADTCAGGIAGLNTDSVIRNSYALGNVTSEGNYVGGAVGYSDYYGYIDTSYAAGDAQGVMLVGGFIGSNQGDIFDCYSSGTVHGDNYAGAFSGSSYGYQDNCYANIEQPEGTDVSKSDISHQEPEWFDKMSNLTFLGDAYDYNSPAPPQLINNRRKEDEDTRIVLQVGANTGTDNQLEVSTNFSMNNYYADVSTQEKAAKTLDDTDKLIGTLSTVRAKCGAEVNRLESVADSLDIRVENVSSSHSTIVDTDFATETAVLTRNQILRDVTASLLSQTNTIPEVALQLLL